jgi:hypothetical protein
VEAMILHAASMAALFLDQTAQAQSAVQCVQAASEPTLKWLLPTIVQTVVSLASISAGVLIAVWSFKKNRQLEHEQWFRDQKVGHEQWVRDQKKEEWKELLKKAAEIERVLTSVPLPQRDRLFKVANRLKLAVNRLSVTRASSVFLQDFFKSSVNLNRFSTFIKDAYDADFFVWVFIEVLGTNEAFGINEAFGSDKAIEQLNEADRKIKLKIEEISTKYFDFIEWLRSEAERDLSSCTSEEHSGQD